MGKKVTCKNGAPIARAHVCYNFDMKNKRADQDKKYRINHAAEIEAYNLTHPLLRVRLNLNEHDRLQALGGVDDSSAALRVILRRHSVGCVAMLPEQLALLQKLFPGVETRQALTMLLAVEVERRISRISH